jgi:Family of unknown function (DUF6496)
MLSKLMGIKQGKMQKVMHEFKAGTLKSSSGRKVINRKQAIAIGLSEGESAVKKKRGK